MTTYNTNNPVPSAHPFDLYDNSENLDAAMNGTASSTWNDRKGVPRKSWAGIERDSATGSYTVKTIEELQAITPPEGTNPAGRVTEGPGQGYYLWDGSWQMTTDPLEAYFDEIDGQVKQLKQEVEPVIEAVQVKTVGNEILFLNQDGLVAGKFANDGAIVVALMRAFALSIKGNLIDADSCPPGYVYVVGDTDTGNYAMGIKTDGTVKAGAIEVDLLNGVPTDSLLNPVEVAETRLDGGLVFVNNIGESLGEGSDGALTTTQDFDNVGFPARASSPTAYVPLTVENTQWNVRGESPMYGALDHAKELIEAENGVAAYQMLACNNAVSGRIIAEISKGTDWYARAITQIQSARNIAQAEGRTSLLPANLLTIGTNDVTQGTSRQVYSDLLRALHADYGADTAAITGQSKAPVTIMSQTSHAVDTTQRNIQLAQMDVAKDTSGVFIATPLYFFTYYDTLHIVAESSKWLGGYYGLVYKRVVVDGKKWEHLQPTRHFRQGRVVELSFNADDLVLDTTLMPAQANHGFSVVDGTGADIPISGVSLKSGETIQIVCSANIPVGSKVRYGWNRVVGKGTFTGGGGNLRDSLGDTETYTYDVAGSPVTKPLHRWCAIFEYQL